MKIYLNKLNESWIVDRLKKEWLINNSKISTKVIFKSDIIWIISPWTWKRIPKNQLMTKKVLCSIYHFDEENLSPEYLEEFYERDNYVDEYHVISRHMIDLLKKLTTKKINYIPFWVNQKNWFYIKEKNFLRNKYN